MPVDGVFIRNLLQREAKGSKKLGLQHTAAAGFICSVGLGSDKPNHFSSF